jgi:hypothetical protein
MESENDEPLDHLERLFNFGKIVAKDLSWSSCFESSHFSRD